MKRIWTIWGITALTAVLILGGIVWGIVALLGTGYSDGAGVLAAFGGPAGLVGIASVATWLTREVPE